MAWFVLPVPIEFGDGKLSATNVSNVVSAYSATTFYTEGATVHYEGRKYQAIVGGGAQAATFSSAGDTIAISATPGTFVDEDKVAFGSVGGTLAAPLVEGTTYFVRDKTGANFKVEASIGNGTIDITTTGTGTQSAYENPNYGRTPPSNTDFWLDVGPSNQYAMFDEYSSTQTTGTGTIEVTLTGLGPIDTIAFQYMSGVSTIAVVATSTADGEVFNETFDLTDNSFVEDWYDYFTEDVAFKPDHLVRNIPRHDDLTIDITLTAATSALAIGDLIIGRGRKIGDTQSGARIGIKSRSLKVEDDYGNFSITPRSASKRGEFSVYVPSYRVDALRKLFTDYENTAVLWAMSESYTSAQIVGYYRNFDLIAENHGISECVLSIEGLA